MSQKEVKIEWPNGNCSLVPSGSDWIDVAASAGFNIPTGCLGGSCGACEIDVNGSVIRACISTVESNTTGRIIVKSFVDPYW